MLLHLPLPSKISMYDYRRICFKDSGEGFGGEVVGPAGGDSAARIYGSVCVALRVELDVGERSKRGSGDRVAVVRGAEDERDDGRGGCGSGCESESEEH